MTSSKSKSRNEKYNKKNLMFRVDTLTYSNLKTVAQFNKMSVTELINIVFSNKENVILNYSKKIDEQILNRFKKIVDDLRNDLSL